MMTSVVLGVDPHKRSHTVAAVDEVGRELGCVGGGNDPDGHARLLAWGRRAGERRLWAIEDGQGLARRLASFLLAAGERVVWVPVRLMTAERRAGRSRGKSDPIDALAVARAALREGDLPVAQLDGPARQVRLLVDHREHLVADRTRVISRLRWHLHNLAADLEPAPKALTTLVAVRRLLARLDRLARLPAGPDSTGKNIERDLAVELCEQLLRLTPRINALERQIDALITPLLPATLDLCGVGALTAAKILGEVGDIRRFRSTGAFARHNGTAPVPVCSGKSTRQRLNRGGNRQLNRALHTIAITQLRSHQPAKDLLERRHRTKPGTTHKDAIRVLKRHLSDVIYRTIATDLAAHDQTVACEHPAA